MGLKLLLVVAGAYVAADFLSPHTPVRLGEDTTRIFAPLNADGLPNYSQAVVDEQRLDATRDNNGARLFWRAMGPSGVEHYQLLFQDLDIPEGEEFPYLVDLDGDDMRDRIGEWIQAEPASEVQDESFDQAAAVDEILDRLRKAPWSSDDCPPAADWLTENEAPINLLVRSTAKPRFFSPPPDFLEDPETPVVLLMLPHALAARDAAKALLTRAAFRIGKRDYVAAWQDCLSCWRLGEQIGSGPFIIDRLVGIAIRGLARETTLLILQCEDLPEQLSEEILGDLEGMPAQIRMTECVDVAERYVMLDTALRVMNGQLDGGDLEGVEFVTEAIDYVSFDLNIPLKVANAWMDQMVAALRIDDIRSRRRAVVAFETSLDASLGNFRTAEKWAALFSRQRRSELMADVTVALTIPPINAIFQAGCRDETALALTRVAASLALHRARHGEYPQELDELTPAIFATVPIDPCDGAKSLIYERRDDGYVLYSVFQNGVDDGGRDFSGAIDQGEWLPEDQRLDADMDHSDFVIRMPRPQAAWLRPPISPTW
jgi:hypothetical protein